GQDFSVREQSQCVYGLRDGRSYAERLVLSAVWLHADDFIGIRSVIMVEIAPEQDFAIGLNQHGAHHGTEPEAIVERDVAVAVYVVFCHTVYLRLVGDVGIFGLYNDVLVGQYSNGRRFVRDPQRKSCIDAAVRVQTHDGSHVFVNIAGVNSNAESHEDFAVRLQGYVRYVGQCIGIGGEIKTVVNRAVRIEHEQVLKRSSVILVDVTGNQNLTVWQLQQSGGGKIAVSGGIHVKSIVLAAVAIELCDVLHAVLLHAHIDDFAVLLHDELICIE